MKFLNRNFLITFRTYLKISRAPPAGTAHLQRIAASLVAHLDQPGFTHRFRPVSANPAAAIVWNAGQDLDRYRQGLEDIGNDLL